LSTCETYGATCTSRSPERCPARRHRGGTGAQEGDGGGCVSGGCCAICYGGAADRRGQPGRRSGGPRAFVREVFAWSSSPFRRRVARAARASEGAARGAYCALSRRALRVREWETSSRVGQWHRQPRLRRRPRAQRPRSHRHASRAPGAAARPVSCPR